MNKHLNLAPHDLYEDASPGTGLTGLQAYLNHRADLGLGLPSNLNGRPHLSLIAKSAGVDQASLSKADLKALLLAHEDCLGLDGFPRRGPATVAELDWLGFSALLRKRGADNVVFQEVEVATLRAAIDFMRSTLADRMLSPARPCLDLALAAVADDGLRGALEFLDSVLREVEENGGVPNHLPDALNFLVERSGALQKDLERQCGMPRRLLENFKSGARAPTQRWSASITRLEALFDVAPGSLTKLIRARVRGWGLIPAKYFPADIAGAQTRKERIGISRYLPDDFAERDEAARRALIHDVLDHIRSASNDYNRARHDLQRQPYFLGSKTWPAAIDAETNDLMSFYGSITVPLKKRREGGGWKEATRERYRSVVGGILGFFRSDFNESFFVDPEALALALLIFPELVQPYIDWRAARLAAAFDRDFLTRSDVDIFAFGRWLTLKEFGYIRQHPELAQRLTPVLTRDGRPLITEQMIAEARSDWGAACDRAFDTYSERVKSHEDKIEVSRDPHEAILPILKLDNPLTALSMAIEGLQKELDGMQPATPAYMVVVRDRVMFAIMTQTGFRLSTVFKLDMSHLNFKDGRWHLKVPRKNFKNARGPWFRVQTRVNRRSPAFRDYYERVLIDKHGLYKTLGLYLDEVRPALLGNSNTRALFVASTTEAERDMWKQYAKRAADPGRLSLRGIRRSVERVFNRHVAWDPSRKTGIPDFVSEVGPHAIRHILATGMLKKTLRLDLAADAIHDSKQMVERAYIRYLPSDREQDLLNALDTHI